MQKNILIVDDEIDICNYLKDTLEYETYKVDAVKTGEEALEKLNHASFDVVLIDVRLETRVSGVDVIKRCRELPLRPKIVIISATPERLLKPVFEQEGILDLVGIFLEKPAGLKPEVIVRHVKTVLGR